jgi:hypothetical protein
MDGLEHSKQNKPDSEANKCKHFFIIPILGFQLRAYTSGEPFVMGFWR